MSLKLKLVKKFISFVFPDVKKYADKEPVFRPSPDSPRGLLVPELVLLYGDSVKHLLKIIFILPYFIGTAFYSRKCVKSVKRNPLKAKKHASRTFFEKLEKYARALGILKIGYTKLTPELVFSNRTVLYENAIVLLMEMDKEKIMKAPSIIAGIEVWRTYYRLTRAAYKIAEFLRRHGYNAQPDPAVGGSTNFPLLAQKAGLGYIGKHGLLITPESGPSVRITAIYTDLELPYTDENMREYEWIPEFCEYCNNCVRTCPTKAIYTKPIKINNREIHIDYGKCIKVFAKTLGCSICIKECPFTKTKYTNLKNAYRIIVERRIKAHQHHDRTVN
ncbi:MAG: reductive dehalogenase domain-containing protein [Thermoprotei archaeon]